jgi:hypothetical protein
VAGRQLLLRGGRRPVGKDPSGKAWRTSSIGIPRFDRTAGACAEGPPPAARPGEPPGSGPTSD